MAPNRVESTSYVKLMTPRLMDQSTAELKAISMSTEAAKPDGFFYVLKDSIRILLVDDDPILREFAIVHLSSETAEVQTAGDGIEALDILGRSPVDVVLLDLEMPKMDGFAVLRQLRGEPRTAELPVIVVTGREDVGAIDRAFETGATSFVVKPINWRLLSYQIRFVRRAWKTERVLSRAHREARAGSERTGEALGDLAREGERFMRVALSAAPELRPAAGGFASALERLSAAALAAAEG
jgi:CheY-like chemotaxis protein